MTTESGQRVALVTGGNRGIGLAVCRQLARQGFRTLLGSRDGERGARAAHALAEEGLAVEALTLDVADEASVRAAAERVSADPGRLDVLVNNAGIFLDRRASDGASVLNVDCQRLRDTLEVNTYGALRVTQALLALLRRAPHARIVNVSSGMGQLAEMGGGWPAYRLSKTALNALTRMLADELRADGVLVNSICPGWVRTDMGGGDAPRSPEQAAEGVVWAATLPDDGPSGGFFRDGEPIAW